MVDDGSVDVLQLEEQVVQATDRDSTCLLARSCLVIVEHPAELARAPPAAEYGCRAATDWAGLRHVLRGPTLIS